MKRKSPRTSSPAVQYDPPGAFIAALAAGAIVEFFDGPLDAPWLAFRLQSGGKAIHLVTPQGEIVGTFASALAAARYGFERLDREAERRNASDPESSADDAVPRRSRR